MSNWVENPDGTVTVTVQVIFDGSYDALGTGTATLIITPDGGSSTLSALLDGDPGQPPTIRNLIVNTVLPTTSGSGSATLVSAGGAGVASVYDLTLNIPQGVPGVGSVGTILNAADLANSPTAGQILSFDGTKGLWVPNAPVSPYYVVPASSFSAINGTTGTASGQSVALTIPGQPYRWRPMVECDMEMVTAADTRVDLQIMMGPSTSTAATIAATGTQVGYGRGQASATGFHVSARPMFGVSMTPSDSSPAAVVASGTAQTIVVSAVRQYGTSVWSTTTALSELRVRVQPV